MMGVETSKFSLDKRLGQSFEMFPGAKPRKTIAEKLNGGTELFLISTPYQRIDPVSADDEIGRTQFAKIFDWPLIDRLNADRLCSFLQQLEELQTSDRGESDTINHDAFATKNNGYVVP